mmetsp:Transcript_13706/g.43098  ORF Transcript_13706/g.43098 Transcript_13706/m.43098 type:complete len:266 (-) Transcript_13706:1629-2426(-)
MQSASVEDFNAFATCTICNGYLRDARTITECLHSFCKICIVRLIEEQRIDCCPICQISIKPALDHLAVDRVKQQLVDAGIPHIALADYQAEFDFLEKQGKPIPAELTDRLNVVRKFVAARAPEAAASSHATQRAASSSTNATSAIPSTATDDGGRDAPAAAPVSKRARTGDLVTLTLEPDSGGSGSGSALPPLAKSVIRIDPSVTVRRLRRFIVQRLPTVDVDASDIRLSYAGTNLGPEWNLEYIRKTLARDATVPTFLYSLTGS